MSELKTKNRAADKEDDWAILPFDEAEDDARWKNLIEETDQLIKNVGEMEAVHGPLLTENRLSDPKNAEDQAEENPF